MRLLMTEKSKTPSYAVLAPLLSEDVSIFCH
uniref:Uncharacterized protein n=1 Tax=Anguilla anguilla TaxID=7936 RepID=A0A0E9TBG3_ANGAN